jgi:two-component system secretion response regulator SsrB
MSENTFSCVLLADRYHALVEGVRDMLATMFETVVMVGDERSLLASAERLQPQLAVVDLTLTQPSDLGWIDRLRTLCPGLKLIVLSVHDEPSVREAATQAGANGFVLKRDIATGLTATIDALLGHDAEESAEGGNGGE